MGDVQHGNVFYDDLSMRANQNCTKNEPSTGRNGGYLLNKL